jgi:probable HAF family extracellular repeat protein
MRLITKLIMLWLTLGSLLFAADYRFVRIDFPDAAATFASGINARGDIVGRYDDANGVVHGFLLRKGIFSSIDFPNASFTSARAINARGDIAGRIHDANGNDHAFLLRDGQFTQIDYPEADATVGRGINNAGDVTGNYSSSHVFEAGFILRDGVFYNVRVPHSVSTDVWMAEDNGRVMVGDAVMSFDGALHGFVRSKPGDFQLIDFPTGLPIPCTGPRWINERGDIVGLFVYAYTFDDCFADNPLLHGFLLRQGKYVAIDFPGSTSTNALAINDDGEIVGYHVDKKGNTHGFKAVPRSGH